MSTRDTKQALLLGLGSEIESEMKKLGLWSATATPAQRSGKAFGADSLSFEEWLQHVFLPRLKQAALSSNYPSRSSVAVAAVRNLDGVQGAEHLIDLLLRVDSVIERSEKT